MKWSIFGSRGGLLDFTRPAQECTGVFSVQECTSPVQEWLWSPWSSCVPWVGHLVRLLKNSWTVRSSRSSRSGWQRRTGWMITLSKFVRDMVTLPGNYFTEIGILQQNNLLFFIFRLKSSKMRFLSWKRGNLLNCINAKVKLMYLIWLLSFQVVINHWHRKHL